MTPEAELKAQAEREPRRRFWFHWQNLNDKKDGTRGSGLRQGRCWWHFDGSSRRPDRCIRFEWNLWSRSFGIGFDIDDEDLTLSIGFPPAAFYLSFSTNWWLISKLAPRRPLQYYPHTIVIDERECSIKIHGGKLWIHPWSKQNEWAKNAPWWVRGISFNLNPFEPVHMRHEVRCADGSWGPYVGTWDRDKTQDHRELRTYPYRYVLKSGEIQDRTATVYVERRAWRPRCFRWTSLFERVRTSIDIQFSDEVGERTGSWKGGTIGCGWDLLPNETPWESLRRMQRDRKFD